MIDCVGIDVGVVVVVVLKEEPKKYTQMNEHTDIDIMYDIICYK